MCVCVCVSHTGHIHRTEESSSGVQCIRAIIVLISYWMSHIHVPSHQTTQQKQHPEQNEEREKLPKCLPGL